MPVAKLTVVLAAVLTLLLPASASAGWLIEGEELTTTAALATTAAVDGTPVLTVAGVTVECSGKTLDSVSPQIGSPNKLTASSLEFTSCKSATAACSIASSAIKTKPLIAELTDETQPADVAFFKPKTGTLIAEITFEGEECALEGIQPVKGTTIALLPEGGTESASQPFNWLSEASSGELKLGSNAASFIGAAEFELASGKEFAAAILPLRVHLIRGGEIALFASGEVEYRFGAGETIELELANQTDNNYKIEQEKIEPNETNYKFVAVKAPNNECKPLEYLLEKSTTGKKAICYLAIQRAGTGAATLKLKYKGGVETERKLGEKK